MRIAFFNTKSFDKKSFDKYNKEGHEIVYLDQNLTKETAALAKGFEAVCNFVNADGSKEVLEILAEGGTKLWLQRSMGYNIVDLEAAEKLGIKVYRVDNYSAESVAEHALSLMLSVNRNIVKAASNSERGDFSLEGLIGYSIFESTVGIIGAGKIGQALINALNGLGANVIVFDEYLQKQNPEAGKEGGYTFVTLEELAKTARFVSVHVPLIPATKHILGKEYFKNAKQGQIIINTARGELVDTTALIEALDRGVLGGFGADVLEREKGRFFHDMSHMKNSLFADDKEWATLLSRDNVVITSHLAFLTHVAINTIAKKTLNNIELFIKGEDGVTRIYLGENGKIVNG